MVYTQYCVDLVNSGTTSILTKEFREKLGKKRLFSNDKWNWLDLKRGRLPPKIQELPEDLLHIVYSPHTWELMEDPKTRQNLLTVITVLQGVLAGSPPIPILRIVVKSKNKKRVFVLQELESFKFEEKLFSPYVGESESEERINLKNHLNDLRTEYIFGKIRKGSGLRSSEWKFLKTFYKDNMKFGPFRLPLRRDKEYTWREIKTEFLRKLDQRMELSKDSDPQTLEDKAKSEIRPDIERIKKKLFERGFAIHYRIYRPGLIRN